MFTPDRSFLTAEQLGITAKEHETVLAVLAQIDKGKIAPHNFDMGSCNKCFGGHMEDILGGDFSNYSKPLQGIFFASHSIADPYGEDQPAYHEACRRWSDATPPQAACVVRGFLATGKVDWLILPDPVSGVLPKPKDWRGRKQ